MGWSWPGLPSDGVAGGGASQGLSRRSALGQLGLLLGSGLCSASAAARPRRLLLRSSWQTVNIGDIAHTPGVLHLLEQHLPELEVGLWPSRLDNGVRELLAARFPKVHFVEGEALKRAFEDYDFLLHGSGPSLVAEKDVRRWVEATGKPFGVYGITLSGPGDSAESQERFAGTVDLLGKARFVFFRDSRSLELATRSGCRAPRMEFGPDGAFACDLREEDKALAFLRAKGLEEGRFLCCIPRLRNTPYWRIKDLPKDEAKEARNEAMKFHDHDPHLQAIQDVLAETQLKVLICPEDQTQMQVGKELLYDRLPESAKSRVVWRPDYWLTGEALSVYTRSAGLFENEMHSPIMCIGQGIPAIVCRWAEQTSKGYMWEDIGLGDWLFDFDKPGDPERLPAAVLAMARDPEAARAKAAKARAFVQARQRETMALLGQSLA